MPQSFDPKLGILSSFEGIGSAMSDIGKMGLVDHMETRRSKMEQDLRRQLQGERQEFEVEQAGVESEQRIEAATVESKRKVAAAEKEHGYDVALEREKAKTVRGKKEDPNKYGILTSTGTPMTNADLNKEWLGSIGAESDSFAFSEKTETKLEYMKRMGYRYRTDPVPQPIEPVKLDEAAYRKRMKETYKDIDDSALDEMVKKNRAAGKITGAVTPMPVAEPEAGVFDAMDADATPTAETGEFAGGAPQGQPGALAEVEETVAPDTSYAQMGQAMESERVASAQRNTIQNRLLKHRAKIAKSARQVGRKASKKEAEKIQNATTQVVAALKKGNINQVSKDNLKLALNDAAFVNNLSEADLQILIDYLEQ